MPALSTIVQGIGAVAVLVSLFLVLSLGLALLAAGLVTLGLGVAVEVAGLRALRAPSRARSGPIDGGVA